jgi:hypothetical protein
MVDMIRIRFRRWVASGRRSDRRRAREEAEDRQVEEFLRAIGPNDNWSAGSKPAIE